jgi:type IV secretory pathway TrbD component
MDTELRATPVHRSLLEIKTIGGVEDKLAIMNGTFAVAIVMGLGLWLYLPVAIAMHLILARMTRRDPFTRRIYMRYNAQADRYDPWPHARQRRNRRPEGFGRSLLC